MMPTVGPPTGRFAFPSWPQLPVLPLSASQQLPGMPKAGDPSKGSIPLPLWRTGFLSPSPKRQPHRQACESPQGGGVGRSSQTHLPHSFPLVHSGEGCGGWVPCPLPPSHPRKEVRRAGGIRVPRARVLLPPLAVSSRALALTSLSTASQPYAGQGEGGAGGEMEVGTPGSSWGNKVGGPTLQNMLPQGQGWVARRDRGLDTEV